MNFNNVERYLPHLLFQRNTTSHKRVDEVAPPIGGLAMWEQEDTPTVRSWVVSLNQGGNCMPSEQQPSPNRIVVYGSNISGAVIFRFRFQEYLNLRGIDNASVQFERDVVRIELAFYGQSSPEDEKTIPLGVVTFPEMRQYDPLSGCGMFIDTYGNKWLKGPFAFDRIKNLCNRHRVPLVKMDGQLSEESSFLERLNALLPPNLG